MARPGPPAVVWSAVVWFAGVCIAVACLAATAAALDRLLPPDLSRFHDRSRAVLAEDGRALRVFTSSDDKWRLLARPDDVDPKLIRFLIAYEDKRFDSHVGVDPLALARAAWQWLAAGRIVSGGSTLTMQVARLLEPRPRTLPAKAIEIARAIQLERRFTKAEILGMYLTLAPYGGNLEGVRAAATAWFGKEPRRLTDAEAALLVALPQSPTRLRPDLRPEAARGARNKVLTRLAVAGVLSSARVAEARTAPVPQERRAFAFEAPHLARRLLAASEAEAVRSTIDADMQAAAARVVDVAMGTLERPLNAAAIVVENAERKVRAWIGSGDFADPRRAGQVDFARGLRSPGSALKPFVYGLAFDAGLVAPETLLPDRSRRFGAWSPRNFSGDFVGDVTAAEALQRSLNVPAVILLEAYGPNRFVARFREAGVPLTFPDAHEGPGLAVGLGGAGVTLEELVTLFAGLADGGRVVPLVDRADDSSGDTVPAGFPLMGRNAADQVARILTGVPRPLGAPAGPETALAYKTGTSWGYRDAWAIGFDGRFTIGVWVGRPDGSPMLGRTGHSTAAPILFQIATALPPDGRALRLDDPGEEAPLVRDLRPARIAGGGQGGAAVPFALTFPADGSVVEIARAEALLPIEVTGGRRPFTWLVNDEPVASGGMRRRHAWQPDSPGFYSLAVVDAEGRHVRARVELR